jgi:tetratricopeptide (TPR) repeat protein/O-antigen ligase
MPVNPESNTETRLWQNRRIKAERFATAAGLLCALVFLAAWPWEIFQRIYGGPTLVLVASVLILGFGLIREEILFPFKGRLLKGMGLPATLIAVACLQSALHSPDPDASKTLIIKYVWYLLLFAMAAPLFNRPGDASLAWRVFAVSAGLVGVYAVLCAAGWFNPALAGTHEYFGRRLTEEVRVGAFVRIAATTPDYNQAILPMLLALPFLLVWAGTRGLRRVGRIAAAVLALFVVAGVTVSFSRSGLLAVTAVFMGGGLLMVWTWMRRNVGQAPSPVELGNGTATDSTGRLSHISDHGQNVHAKVSRFHNRRLQLGLLVGLAVIVVCGLALLAAGGYAEMLVRRALRGFNSPDPSYRSRFYVFGLAFQLLPKYALFGCGIGASGATLGAIAEPGKWMGTAIHSMPLMIWFETGILGLIGYFWLWWALARRVWVGLVRSEESERQVLGFAALGAAGVLFWMTAIQPFQELSLFPLIAALIAGPTREMTGEDTPVAADRSRRWRIAFACAMVLVALLVTKDILSYQSAVSTLSRYAVGLEEGLAAEQRGDWETACIAYEAAEQLATHAPHHGIMGGRMEYMPYYREAFHANDLEFIYLRLPGRGGWAEVPDEVAEFGLARCLWNAGKTESALKILQHPPRWRYWPETAWAMGEIYWQQGQYMTAINLWEDAVRLNRERKPFPPLEYPFDVSPSMDDICQKLFAEAKSLSGAKKPVDIARRIALLLRLDWRGEVVDALKGAPEDAPELAVFRDALGMR